MLRRFLILYIFVFWRNNPRGPGPPHSRGF